MLWLLLVFATITLLIWNEGRTVKRHKDVDEGRMTIVELDLNSFTNMSIPTLFENQLIHALGDHGSTDMLRDPIFGVANRGMNFTDSTAISTDRPAIAIPIVIGTLLIVVFYFRAFEAVKCINSKAMVLQPKTT